MTEPAPIFAPEANPAPAPPDAAYGAGGIINYPGPLIGLQQGAQAIGQIITAPQNDALGKLHRIAAAVHEGLVPQSIFERPDIQALFPKAGLPPLPINPKLSDIEGSMKAKELDSAPFAPGTPGARAVTGLPSEATLNVQGKANELTREPNTAAVATGLPATPATAASAVRAGELKGQITVSSQIAALGEAQKDPEFKKWLAAEGAGPGVVAQAVEAMRASSEWARVKFGQDTEGARLLGQALTTASNEFSRQITNWKDGLDKARQAAVQMAQLNNTDPDVAAQQAQDAYLGSAAGRKPTFPEVLANITGSTPEEAQAMLRAYTGIKGGASAAPTGPPPLGAPPSDRIVSAVTFARKRIAAGAKPADEKALIDKANFTDAEKQAIKDKLDEAPPNQP